MGETRTAVAVVLALLLLISSLGGSGSFVATAVHQSVTISSPADGSEHFVGEAVTINGTANESVESVALYVRSGGSWLLLDVNRDGIQDDTDTLAVGTAGNWSVRNLVLSNAQALLSYPGNYQLGAVDVSEVGGNETVPLSLPASRLPEAGGTQVVIQLNRARLQGNFLTVGGELPTEDAEVTIEGTARGTRELLVVLVDSRGQVATDRIVTPRGAGEFDEDVALRTSDGDPLAKGLVTGYVMSVGRDGIIGDGKLPNGTNATLDTLAEYISDQPTKLEARQIRERLLGQSVDEAGSDDLMVSEEFRYAEDSTAITSVTPESLVGVEGFYAITAGERMVIQGQTNRLPDDSTITVEATGGPTPGRFPLVWTTDWNLNGSWAVSMDTDDVEPGIYTITADVDGETTDRVQVRILRPLGNVTPGNRHPVAGERPPPAHRRSSLTRGSSTE